MHAFSYPVRIKANPTLAIALSVLFAACSLNELAGGVSDTVSCYACHGNDTNLAPPKDTRGRTDTSLMTVGAHQSHLGKSNWHKEIECVDCHRVPQTASDGHDDGAPAELTWGALASSDSAVAEFDRNTGICSNVYCHGATLAPGGKQTAPVWTRADGSEAVCGSCHGLPPAGDHPANDKCAACHNTVDANNSIVRPNQHIDGKVNGDESSSGHGSGYAVPSEHGQDAKLQETDCRICHGSDLTGGSAGVGCDSCHESGWRRNCTFCHGATDNQTGAPPRDLRGNNNDSSSTVGSHSEHLSGSGHMRYDCNQCHVKPAEILSPGHLFDGTPGEAELSFSDGISPHAVYNNGKCSSVYCHGNGRSDGSIASFTGSITDCNTCHPSRMLSGRHDDHLEEGIVCADCHGAVVNSSGQIIGSNLHVNRAVDVRIDGLNYDGARCTGSCHGEDHNSSRW